MPQLHPQRQASSKDNGRNAAHDHTCVSQPVTITSSKKALKIEVYSLPAHLQLTLNSSAVSLMQAYKAVALRAMVQLPSIWQAPTIPSSQASRTEVMDAKNIPIRAEMLTDDAAWLDEHAIITHHMMCNVHMLPIRNSAH